MRKYSDIEFMLGAMELEEGAGVKVKRYIGQTYSYFDPFLLLDEFKSDDYESYSKGFPPHPHAGFEVMTYMLSGKLRHSDSKGTVEVMEEGDIQFMNTGRGIIHSEMPLFSKQKLLWGFQMWINVLSSLKMSEPFYKKYRHKVVVDGDVLVNIVAGEYKNEKNLNFSRNLTTYILAKLCKNQKVSFVVPEHHTSFIVVSDGLIKLNSESITHSNIAFLSRGIVDILAIDESIIIFASAKSVGEKIIKYGPFVVNTKDQLLEVINEYRNNFHDI
ncbi:MAG: pirin family protein [Brevinematales bacterium]|nr:pirin family protein [Brevinematales bacterium]